MTVGLRANRCELEGAGRSADLRGCDGAPVTHISAMSSRRLLFKASVTVLGQSMYGAARELGVSYNHLVLVLDGKRVGSARLDAAIDSVLDAARAPLAGAGNSQDGEHQQRQKRRSR
jgi:hypothetical protein